VEKFDPIDIEFLINSPEVKKDANEVKKQIKGIGDTAEGVTKKVNGQLNNVLDNSTNKVNKQTAAVKGSKAEWNGLGNSINQISRELPAFTYSAQTGFLALSNNIPILADEIGRLRAKNDALVASGAKGVPIWKSVLKNLFSWNVALSLGVTLITIYGKEIGEFFSQLFKGKEAIDVHTKSVEALNKAYESNEYQKVIKDLITLRSTIQQAKDGIIDKEVALKQYNDTLGKVYKNTDDLNEAERIVVEKAPAYIEAMLYKTAATLAAADAAKQLAENAKAQFETEEEIAAKQKEEAEARAKGVSTASQAQGNFTNLAANSAAFRQKVLADELDELENDAKTVADKSQKIVDDLNKKAAEIAKAAGLDIFGDGKTDPNRKEINERKKLLEKIADLDREYARKQLDRDAEELQALRDKFAKVRALIEEFNADPKNAKAKIDLTGLGVIQQSAETDLQYKQETRALKKELEQQKELFREFEEYRKQFGIEKARERYKGELGEFETFRDYLQDIIKRNEAAFEAVAYGTNTGGQGDRVDMLTDLANTEKRIQAEKLNDLLAELMTFEEKRKLLTEKYNAERQKVLEAGAIAEAEILRRKFEEQLDALGEEYAESTEAYKRLLRGVDGLSRAAAQSVIDSAQKMVNALLAAGVISQETAQDIQKKIDALSRDLDNNTANKLNEIARKTQQIASAFLDLGDSVGYFDEGLGDTITTIGELAAVAGDAAQAGASFASGDIVGGITSTISAISGVFRIAAKARESERKAKEELLRINQRIEDGERRINEILRDRNILRAQEVEFTLDGIAAQREALKLAQQQNAQDEAALLKQLQGQQYITGSYTEKYGGFLGIGRKTRVVNEYASLLGKTFEDIERFYEQGQLDDRAKELFEQLRNLKEEGADINGMLDDLQAKANEIFTGTTSNAISDSIIEGLRQGKDSFEDFSGDIETMLQAAILNGIKYQVLEEPLKQLYENFAAYAESEGELSATEAQAIRDQYQAQVQKAIDQYEQWSSILDEDLVNGNQTQQGLQGAIRREMTEETASELTGLSRGQYDITKKHFQLSERWFAMEQKCCDATMNIMASNALIEENTRNTVIQVMYAVAELKTISKQTKSASGRDLGKPGG